MFEIVIKYEKIRKDYPNPVKELIRDIKENSVSRDRIRDPEEFTWQYIYHVTSTGDDFEYKVGIQMAFKTLRRRVMIDSVPQEVLDHHAQHIRFEAEAVNFPEGTFGVNLENENGIRFYKIVGGYDAIDRGKSADRFLLLFDGLDYAVYKLENSRLRFDHVPKSTFYSKFERAKEDTVFNFSNLRFKRLTQSLIDTIVDISKTYKV